MKTTVTALARDLLLHVDPGDPENLISATAQQLLNSNFAKLTVHICGKRSITACQTMVQGDL